MFFLTGSDYVMVEPVFCNVYFTSWTPAYSYSMSVQASMHKAGVVIPETSAGRSLLDVSSLQHPWKASHFHATSR